MPTPSPQGAAVPKREIDAALDEQHDVAAYPARQRRPGPYIRYQQHRGPVLLFDLGWKLPDLGVGVVNPLLSQVAANDAVLA
jgi:hypothetical protein